MHIKQSAKISTIVLSVVFGSPLVSTAGPAVADEILVATSKKTTTYDRNLISQARKANQARSGNDDEWDECMSKDDGDFIGTLVGCFCLTTPQAPCGEDHSEPVKN